MSREPDPNPNIELDRQVARFMLVVGMIFGAIAAGVWLKSCTG